MLTQMSFASPNRTEAIAKNGIVYNGIGVGYSDGVEDNERFGMRRLYYTSTAYPYNDTGPAAEYYNL